METKKCFKCGQEKLLTEFYKHGAMKDGHLGKCKECTIRDTAEHRESSPESYLHSRLKSHSKNPTHVNSARVVEAALMAGVLEKPDYCQGCGRKASETRISAHHHDYSKPLDVIWVCAACHRPLDKVRAYVEEGRSWDEYKKSRQWAYNHIKRALEFYRDNCNHRKEFNVNEILKNVRF